MSTTHRDLIIYGAGGIGSEIVSMAESGCNAGYDTPQWRIIGFVDDTPGLAGQTIHGVPCLGSFEQVAASRAGTETFCHIAVGDNEGRRSCALRIEQAGWQPATVVHSGSYLSWEVELGAGSFLGLLATVSPYVKIGRYTLINTRASIGHHAVLGDFSQISLAASLLGHTQIGTGAMIGAHAVVMSGITVGAWATVAIGTPVMRDVQPGHTISLPLARTFFKRKVLPD